MQNIRKTLVFFFFILGQDYEKKLREGSIF
jgi:hypothetical protein